MNAEHQPDEDNEALFEHYRIEVDAKQSPLRIDKFLMDRIPNISRNKVQSGIKEGFVRVDDREIKPNYKIKPNDVITVSLPDPPRDSEILPEAIPLDIIFEDEYLLVIDKPAGMVVHPAYNNWDGTLVNALVHYFNNLPTMKNNEGRPGLVHRIDKDTSGLLVIAKNEMAMNSLARQFLDHSIERTYLALIWGEPDQKSGTINVNLGRSQKDRRIITAYHDRGKKAITHYRVIKELRYVSLVECELETGRTHQIRAHMKYLGHPIFNDTTYGGDRILKGTKFSKYKAFIENCFKLMPRQALHAKTLGFIHPNTHQDVTFNSPIPPDFQGLLDKWERYVQYN